MTEAMVLGWMLRLAPYSPWLETYQETAAAIAYAAESDPLFGGKHGSVRTAALLTAVAFYETRFRTSAVGEGGRAFGLYQIRPPASGPAVTANLLLNAKTASLVAIDRLREVLRARAGVEDLPLLNRFELAGELVERTSHEAGDAPRLPQRGGG